MTTAAYMPNDRTSVSLSWFLRQGFSIHFDQYQDDLVIATVKWRDMVWGKPLRMSEIPERRGEGLALQFLRRAAFDRIFPLARAIESFEDSRLDEEEVARRVDELAEQLGLESPDDFEGLEREDIDDDEIAAFLKGVQCTGRSWSRVLKGLAKFTLTDYEDVVFLAPFRELAMQRLRMFRRWARRLGIGLKGVQFRAESEPRKLRRGHGRHSLLVADHLIYAH